MFTHSQKKIKQTNLLLKRMNLLLKMVHPLIKKNTLSKLKMEIIMQMN